MTDIVERLRVWPTIEVASVLERQLMNEARHEIERLRAERASDQQRLFHYEAIIERLREEIEKFR
jgi:hypothetical protein